MDYKFYRLNNGVRVVTVPMIGVQSVAVGCYVGVGSRYETPENSGISHFVEHVVAKGTAKFKDRMAVATFLEKVGGVANAGTSCDYTVYYCKVPSDRVSEGLEYVSQMVLEPTFPEGEVVAESKVILEEMKWIEDRPDELVDDVLHELMYQGHPLGKRIIGRPEVIAKMTRDEAQKYHRRHYVADNMVVVMAGKLTQQVETLVEQFFGQAKTGQVEKQKRFEIDQHRPRIKWVSQKDARQTNVALGLFGTSLHDPRRFMVDILTSILGQGFTGRLHEEVREKRGLCYGIWVQEIAFGDVGSWVVRADLNAEKLPEALRAILAELERAKTVKVGEDELAVAKEKIRAPLLFALEDPMAVLRFYGRQVLEKPDEVMTYDMVMDKLMAIDSDKILQVARELLVTEHLNLAAVGPGKQAGLVELLKI